MKSLAQAGKLAVLSGTLLLSASMLTVGSVSADTNNCIDGTVRNNLAANYVGTVNVISVHTVNNRPLCTDVNLYLSDYIMPANYNGGGIADPTATPQTLYKSVPITLTAGSTGTTASVDLPDACNNVQTDLYYAPEITTVGRSGHGTQYIAGYVIASNGTTCQTGGMGGGDSQTPPDSTPPQVLADSTTTPSAQLTDTGLNTWVASAIAAVTMMSAIIVSRKKAIKA